MYAVVATGGKQLKVTPGDVVAVEKLDAGVGEKVSFEVLFVADDKGKIKADQKALAKASVTGEVLEHFKDNKAVVFKFKKRKGYKRTKGHRQELTRVLITDVATTPKRAPRKKAASTKAEDVAAAVIAEAAGAEDASEAAVIAGAATEVTEAAPEATEAPEAAEATEALES